MAFIWASICYAPTEEGQRCVQPVVEGHRHCSVHLPLAQRTYKKYAKLKTLVAHVLDKDHTQTEDIQDLFRDFVLLQKTCKYRLRHRMYSFVPEEWDEGHQKWLALLQDKSLAIEQRITELFTCADQLVESRDEQQMLALEEAPSQPRAIVDQKQERLQLLQKMRAKRLALQQLNESKGLAMMQEMLDLRAYYRRYEETILDEARKRFAHLTQYREPYLTLTLKHRILTLIFTQFVSPSFAADDAEAAILTFTHKDLQEKCALENVAVRLSDPAHFKEQCTLTIKVIDAALYRVIESGADHHHIVAIKGQEAAHVIICPKAHKQTNHQYIYDLVRAKLSNYWPTKGSRRVGVLFAQI